MKTSLLIATLIYLSGSMVSGQAPIVLSSPGKKIRLEVSVKGQHLFYSVFGGNQVLMKNNEAGLFIAGSTGQVGQAPKKKFYSIAETIRPVVPFKKSEFPNNCNVLRLDLSNEVSVEFRAYDNAMAYRFLTNKKDSIDIAGELASVHLPADANVTWSRVDGFRTDYQVLYARREGNVIPQGEMSILPISIKSVDYRITLSETDLSDYPCMFLKKEGSLELRSAFPKYPVAFSDDGDRSVKITGEAGYIARTKGTRSYPWRFFLITTRDEEILENTMPASLTPQPDSDFSWVKPGQVVWEWWHDARVYGVDFKSGYNQATYKYYIDFASRHQIPYILMDEGWAKTTLDPFTPNPSIDLDELVAYGRSRNVRILLWFTWLAVENNPGVFQALANRGIAGMKIDFMDRSDQWMVNYYERVARKAAEHKLLVDFHGAFKPAGLEIRYPNVLSYEGVVGMEANIFYGVATPANNCYLPFLRNAVGPMDYTPGAMISVHPKDFFGNRTNTMSIGTRAHQLALYVVFESGLQMLADNPYHYLKEPDALDFITSVPVTWDDTKALKATEGEFLIVARKKGEKWFIGGITNSTSREIPVNLDFLEKGRKYRATIIEDGVNADIQAMDYRKIQKAVTAGDVLPVSMVADGGYVAIIENMD